VLILLFTIITSFNPVNAQAEENSGLYQINNLAFVHQGSTDKFPVVVIDSGVDYTHPDLAPLMYRNQTISKIEVNNQFIENDIFGWDFNEGDAFSYDNVHSYTPEFVEVPNYDKGVDLQTNILNIGRSLFKNTFEIIKASIPMGAPGHGTHVSGIVVEHCNTCAVVPLKIFGKEDLSIGSLSAAIEYTHLRGYKLVNMSLGIDTKYIKDGSDQEKFLKNVIEKMKKYKDILFVVAAGNDGSFLSEANSKFYPAMLKLPNLITVGAVDDNGKLASFSNYDPYFVDLYAPGVEINSTWIDGDYKNLSGTSMSAPMVTGIVGSLWNLNQGMTATQIKELFMSQVPLGAITYKNLQEVSVFILKK